LLVFKRTLNTRHHIVYLQF